MNSKEHWLRSNYSYTKDLDLKGVAVERQLQWYQRPRSKKSSNWEVITVISKTWIQKSSGWETITLIPKTWIQKSSGWVAITLMPKTWIQKEEQLRGDYNYTKDMDPKRAAVERQLQLYQRPGFKRALVEKQLQLYQRPGSQKSSSWEVIIVITKTWVPK